MIHESRLIELFVHGSHINRRLHLRGREKISKLGITDHE